MGGSLTTAEPRDLIRAVMAEEWRVADLATVPESAVAAAIAEIDSAQPLVSLEPKLDGPQSNAIRVALKPIGVKIDPKLTERDASVWLAALLLALSDLPPRVALAAAKRAIHRPVRFFNQVDGIVREIADEIIEQRREARGRLRFLQDKIRAAANPAPALEQKPMVWTQADVDAANASFKANGLVTRYRLDPDQPGEVISFIEIKKATDIDAPENQA